MTEQSNQPQNPPAGNEQPEVYSVSQDKDGSFHFTRRDFVYISAAIGGVLLLRGACPRFASYSPASEPVQAAMMPVPGVSLHTAPNIASNIADTLQPNDYVRLIRDHPDLGWVEVATQSGQQGWVKRSLVDFSRRIESSSPNFDLGGTPTPSPTPTRTDTSRTFSVQLRGGDHHPQRAPAAGQAQSCGQVIENGNFEDGNVSWVEESTGTIIRDDAPDPYRGSWVAWFGGVDVVERLTQRFHVPADVQDTQKLKFYIKVESEETGDQVVDTFGLRFLDGDGKPATNDVAIANNTTQTDWLEITVTLTGTTDFADQDMQLQFEAVLNASESTSFIVDKVSLEMICEDPSPTPTDTPTPTNTPTVFYIYLPVVVREPAPTPTYTPSPSATPCPSHAPCTCETYTPCTCDAHFCSCESYMPPPCGCEYYIPCTCDYHYCSCEYYYPW